MDPNIVTTLSSIPLVGHYIALIGPWVALVVAIAAATARFFPPPAKSTGWYAAVYFFVNWAGQNRGHAANANAPAAAPVPISSGTARMIVFLLLTGAVLSACSSQQLSTSSAIATDLAPVAGEIAVAKASQPQLADLQGLCDKNDATMADANVVLGSGAASTAQKVDAPLDAFCRVVKQGKVPANADSNSIPWGQTAIIAAIQTIVALARG